MGEMLFGGACRTDFYRLRINSGAYEIRNLANSAAVTDTTGIALSVEGYTEQTALQYQSDGTIKGVLDNYNVTAAMNTSLKTLARKPATAAGNTPTAIAMEHGIKKGGSDAISVPDLLFITYGPSGEGATKRWMHWGVCNLDMSSGAPTYKDGQWIKPVITFNGKAAEYELTIPEELFEGTLVKLGSGGIGDQVLAQYQNFASEWLLLPS